MPIYEYYCRPCNSKFEMLRPMNRADEDANCPQGHSGGERMLSLVANYRPAGGGSAVLDPGTAESGGHGCACGHGGCGSC